MSPQGAQGGEMRPLWDTDLDGAGVKRLPPAERRLRIVTSMRRKAERAEAVARGTRPGDSEPDIPKDKAGFRRWHDAALGLWSWSDRVVDEERGPNGDLIRRWRLALEAIQLRRGRGRRALQGEIDLRDARITDLELQIAGLLEERRALREALVAARVGKRR